MTLGPRRLATLLFAAVLPASLASAQEATVRGLFGASPLLGDREFFQPGTQPCTIPGYAPSCFHTDQTDDFDRKFHPAQGESSKLPPSDDLHPTANGVRLGDSPLATDGAEPPREELVCANCHGNYEDPRTGARADHSPYDTWKATMMAQAWRDPLVRAAIAVANRGLSQAKIDFSRGEYADGPRGQNGRTAGDYCIRCHSPVGWLEGFSLPADGSRVHGKQMDGVQCDFCHRMVNPLTHTAKVPDEYDFTRNLPDSLLEPRTKEIGVSILHNGNFIVNTTGRKIGPFADPVDLGQHPLDAVEGSAERAADPQFDTAAEENVHFVRNSQFCAVCHNVTNPFLVRLLPDGTPVTVDGRRQKMPVERTYTEWYFSDCGPPEKTDPNRPLPRDLPGTDGPDSPLGCEGGHRSCQSCHMPETEGFAADPQLTGVGARGPRTIRQHSFVGGNAWIPATIPLFFPDQLPLLPAFKRIRALARENLERAATLEIRREGSTLRIDVVNHAGHKLPTGYPEGRRMWLRVRAFDGPVHDEVVSCYPEETAEDGAGLPRGPGDVPRCLRFEQVAANLGEGPLELRYRPGLEPDLRQVVHRSDGTAWERTAEEKMEFHPVHGHWHYRGFGLGRLYDSAGNLVRENHKTGFCLIEVDFPGWGAKGNSPRRFSYPGCQLPNDGEEVVQGIGPGWADVYNWFLADQYIDVTGLPDGDYRLEIVADPDDTLLESNEHDNARSVWIRIEGTSVCKLAGPGALCLEEMP